MTKYWEDYQVGERFTTPGRTIGEGMINIIAGLAGFTVPFFWDEEVARKSIYGTRIAPGRLTLLMMGALEEQSDLWDDNTVMALIGMDKIRIKAPLRSGDTIKVESRVIAKKDTSKPDRGIIVHRSTCTDQDGRVLAETESTHLVRKRLSTRGWD